MSRCQWCSRLLAVLAVAAPLGCSVYDSSLLAGSAAISLNDGGSAGQLAGPDAGGGDSAAAGGGAAGSGAVSAGGAPGLGSGGSGGAAAGSATAGDGGAPAASGAAGLSGLGGAGGSGANGLGGGAGASGAAGAAGGQGPIELAQGKPVLASTQQIGNDPARGNDGDASTRWCAVNANYPQWWRVDLGASHPLSQVSIQFEHPERTYSYVLETSQNDAVYTQVAMVNGTGAVQTVDLPANCAGRYLRITITGGTPYVDAGGTVHPTWASFFELSLLGI